MPTNISVHLYSCSYLKYVIIPFIIEHERDPIALEAAQQEYRTLLEGLWYREGFLPNGIDKLREQGVYTTFSFTAFDNTQLEIPERLAKILELYLDGAPAHLDELAFDEDSIRLYWSDGLDPDNPNSRDVSLEVTFDTAHATLEVDAPLGETASRANQIGLLQDLLQITKQVKDKMEISID